MNRDIDIQYILRGDPFNRKRFIFKENTDAFENYIYFYKNIPLHILGHYKTTFLEKKLFLNDDINIYNLKKYIKTSLFIIDSY